MKTNRRTRPLLAMLLLPLLIQCYAYRPPPTEPPYWRAGRVYVGDRVLIHTVATGRLEGTLVRLDTAAVVVRVARADHALPVSAVDSIWTHRGTFQAISTGAGILAGLVGGVALLGATGIGEQQGRQAALISVSILLGAPVLGGYIGSEAGRGRTSWKLVYPR